MRVVTLSLFLISFSILLAQSTDSEIKKIERREGGAVVLLEYPELKVQGETEKAINQSIQMAILNMFDPNAAGSLESTISEFIRSQKELYPDVQKTFSKKVQIVFQNESILTLRVEESSQTGSGPSQSKVAFTNIDLSTGQTMALSDLLKTGVSNQVDQLAEAQFQADQTSITAGQTIKWPGIQSLSNFSLNEGGLTFYLDPTSPNPNPGTQVTLPLARIEKLLKDRFATQLQR
ncbi:MAG: hypothetical protein H6510_05510 [Acidobacteria bacterium]|nr:hypothetical protein [Acidobacteriota bacterium]MCB9397251.1 hypothetical protein [Acidobacteriota bacterium]